MKVSGMRLVLVLVLAGAAVATTMTVQVKQARIKDRPSQLGKTLGTLSYGEAVDVGLLQRGWYPVTLPGPRQGWLHQSTLSTKKLTLQAGSTDTAIGVSNDEVALAGKGFNEQVENKLKEEGTLDFTWVDRMATFVVSEDQIRTFLVQGDLEGGAQ